MSHVKIFLCLPLFVVASIVFYFAQRWAKWEQTFSPIRFVENEPVFGLLEWIDDGETYFFFFGTCWRVPSSL